MIVVAGGRWTIDGRWVVVAHWHGVQRIVYDPGNGDPWADIDDCLHWVRERVSTDAPPA